jgi:hypothetical protein
VGLHAGVADAAPGLRGQRALVGTQAPSPAPPPRRHRLEADWAGQLASLQGRLDAGAVRISVTYRTEKGLRPCGAPRPHLEARRRRDDRQPRPAARPSCLYRPWAQAPPAGQHPLIVGTVRRARGGYFASATSGLPDGLQTACGGLVAFEAACGGWTESGLCPVETLDAPGGTRTPELGLEVQVPISF